MMNLLSEPTVEAVALPSVVADAGGGMAARLEYRALEDDQMEVTYPGTGERRRTERRMLSQHSAPTRSMSDDAWREAVRAAKLEGLAQGAREGRSKARAEMEAEMHAATALERERIARTVEEFAAAKARYFSEIEGQVVRLALAIAARVLHRETQMDALVLEGAVRVALDKLGDSSGVVLRAAAADVTDWEGLFAGKDMTHAPKVIGDAKLKRGDCVLETAMGTVELGVETQLEEIEKGFFDLLRLNPAVRA